MHLPEHLKTLAEILGLQNKQKFIREVSFDLPNHETDLTDVMESLHPNIEFNIVTNLREAINILRGKDIRFYHQSCVTCGNRDKDMSLVVFYLDDSGKEKMVDLPGITIQNISMHY